MDSKEQINNLKAELDSVLRILQLVYKLNSRGKTKEIADEIRPTLEYYNRQ
jgi:hypothetical protein